MWGHYPPRAAALVFVFVLIFALAAPVLGSANYGACVVDDNEDGTFAPNTTDFCVAARTPRECMALKGRGKWVLSAPGLSCPEAWSYVQSSPVSACLPLDGSAAGCDDAVALAACSANGGLFVLNAECADLRADDEDWMLPTCERDAVCVRVGANADAEAGACRPYCNRATFQCTRPHAGDPAPWWAWTALGGGAVVALGSVGAACAAGDKKKARKEKAKAKEP